MNQAETFHLKVLNELSTYSTEKVDKYFLKLFLGDERDKSYWREIYRQYEYPCYYYQYLACAVRILKAKQVVEIGADRGASTVMMLSEGAKVHSLDIRDGWEYVRSHKNLTRYIGDSLNSNLFKPVELKETKLWLIDGLHTYERVKAELGLYQQYMQTGAVVLLDDVQEYKDIWNDIRMDKFLSFDIHGGGVGIICV